jgi:hypothetical protein
MALLATASAGKRVARQRVGYVYLFRLGEFIKIGSSRNPQKRFKAFSSLPYPAEIVHQIASQDAGAVEIALHWRFHTLRIKREWFRLTPEQVARLCELTTVDSVADLPADLQPPTTPPYRRAHGKGGCYVTIRQPHLVAAILGYLTDHPGEKLRSLAAVALKDYLSKEGYWPPKEPEGE